ncbi:hypothetical protein JCM17846_17540 [Iodidimonas nitroreducens]|uniref:2-oxoacid dehydrogenase acyltransferase catalytic domain-containing protein n=1 Tax=Iodidimonas nitroreducens TaxID=1236968 RepID=A0A5A7N6X8_9PROT|nr:hypothetical protein JCM17846_17540 [Iodidimonas nitroreducens]
MERQPFSSLRRKIAQNMIQSKNTSAHVLQAVEADFFGVERVRSFMKGAWRSAEGASLTYLLHCPGGVPCLARLSRSQC